MINNNDSEANMRSIDLNGLADNARFNKFHLGVLLWCSAIIVFDGYDLAVSGIALPSIMKEMGVDATSAGFMVSSALFGMMFGNVLLGTIADRIGRRWAIALCVTLFSVFSAAAGLVSDPVTFSAMRFLAGLGIGGVMPNVIAHMTEYSPKRIRATMVTLMFSGYSVGGMLAALLGKGLIESYGWQSVFLAAAAPVVLLPFMLASLPESMAFLLKKGRTAELRAIAARMEPAYVPRADDRMDLPGTSRNAAPLRALFAEGRGTSTLMFWLTCFMTLFMVYALSSWLAKLMAGAGYGLGSALTFVLVLNAGAIIGAVGGGALADRFPIKRVLAGMYLAAAVSITLLGQGLPTAALYVVVALAGATTIGTQIVICAYCGQYYPMAIRSTGVGFMLGFARIGAISAPIVIGLLVSMELPLQHNFVAIALPSLLAAVTVALIDNRRSAFAGVDRGGDGAADARGAGAVGGRATAQ
jgi:AAHS family benzoate transporter-like MFS transporter